MKKIMIFLLISCWTIVTSADVISSSVRVNGRNYSADWYVPANANGLVFLQHGFTANKSNMRDLGNALMESNLMVLAISSSVTGGNFNLASGIADLIASGGLNAPQGVTVPSKLVLAGHSAGGLHVSMIGKNLVEAGYQNLAGVILFDPVEASRGMAGAFPVLSSANVPVLAILANGGSCNSRNNAQPILANIGAQDFVGMKLTNRSSHLDSFGSNTSWFQRLFCGTPRANNINTVQEFTANWANDMFAGRKTGAYYPGGSALEALISSNNAVLIK